MATTVVNKRKEPYDLDITRKGPWGNPYVIGRDGTREEVIQKHMVDLRRKKWLWPIIVEKMRGRRLGCVCKPLPCHGDNYVDIAEGRVK